MFQTFCYYLNYLLFILNLHMYIVLFKKDQRIFRKKRRTPGGFSHSKMIKTARSFRTLNVKGSCIEEAKKHFECLEFSRTEKHQDAPFIFPVTFVQII